jgi:hypothetical protein
LVSPIGWVGSDSFFVAFGKSFNPAGTFVPQISKVPGHSGSFAAKVETKFQDDIGGFIGNAPTDGGLLNYKINIDLSTGTPSFSGGLPFTSRPASISFWIKTNIVGDDYADFIAQLIDNSDANEEILYNADTTFLTTDTTWKKVTIPFKKSAVDGTILVLRVEVNTSTLDSVASIGTYAIIDDIEVQYPTGVSTYLLSSGMAKVYPNPSNQSIQIDVPEANQYRFQLVSMNGKVLMNRKLLNTKNSIESVSIPAGMYTYQIMGGGDGVVQSNKISIVH